MILLEVNIDEIVPVMIAISDIPESIIMTAKTLPKIVLGVISPYPTVVIVTMVHQRAFPRLLNSLVSSRKVIIIEPPSQIMMMAIKTFITGFILKKFINYLIL